MSRMKNKKIETEEIPSDAHSSDEFAHSLNNLWVGQINRKLEIEPKEKKNIESNFYSNSCVGFFCFVFLSHSFAVSLFPVILDDTHHLRTLGHRFERIFIHETGRYFCAHYISAMNRICAIWHTTTEFSLSLSLNIIINGFSCVFRWLRDVFDGGCYLVVASVTLYRIAHCHCWFVIHY